MQQPMQPILQHLFQAASLDEISRQRLESFVGEYPSFGIGHYLLSRKLQAEGAEHFAAETQKTSLYFTNPLWLQWQLDHVSFANGAGTTIATEPIPIAAAPVTDVEVPSEELSSGDDLAETVNISDPVEFSPGEAEHITAGEGETIPEAAMPVAATEDAEPSAAEPEPSAAEPQPSAANAEPSAADALLRSIAEAKGLRESLHKINDDFNAEAPIAAQAPPAAAEEPIHDEEPPFVLEEPEEPAKPAVQPAKPEPEPAPIFEPYHTIDYFASQGIKLTLDENPGDQLGKQLKSFTEWLKGMRRLPRKDREVIPDRVAEEAIQTIAAHSIEGKDVLTETMAEVLAKQGMRERARAVYEKLSLLNPDKRAYFAAKIEQLNIP